MKNLLDRILFFLKIESNNQQLLRMVFSKDVFEVFQINIMNKDTQLYEIREGRAGILTLDLSGDCK